MARASVSLPVPISPVNSSGRSWLRRPSPVPRRPRPVHHRDRPRSGHSPKQPDVGPFEQDRGGAAIVGKPGEGRLDQQALAGERKGALQTVPARVALVPTHSNSYSLPPYTPTACGDGAWAARMPRIWVCAVTGLGSAVSTSRTSAKGHHCARRVHTPRRPAARRRRATRSAAAAPRWSSRAPSARSIRLRWARPGGSRPPCGRRSVAGDAGARGAAQIFDGKPLDPHRGASAGRGRGIDDTQIGALGATHHQVPGLRQRLDGQRVHGHDQKKVSARGWYRHWLARIVLSAETVRTNRGHLVQDRLRLSSVGSGARAAPVCGEKHRRVEMSRNDCPDARARAEITAASGPP